MVCARESGEGGGEVGLLWGARSCPRAAPSHHPWFMAGASKACEPAEKEGLHQLCARVCIYPPPTLHTSVWVRESPSPQLPPGEGCWIPQGAWPLQQDPCLGLDTQPAGSLVPRAGRRGGSLPKGQRQVHAASVPLRTPGAGVAWQGGALGEKPQQSNGATRPGLVNNPL